jgi:hypothetical protein
MGMVRRTHRKMERTQRNKEKEMNKTRKWKNTKIQGLFLKSKRNEKGTNAADGSTTSYCQCYKTFSLPSTEGQNKVERFSLTSPALGRLYKIFMGVIIVF